MHKRCMDDFCSLDDSLFNYIHLAETKFDTQKCHKNVTKMPLLICLWTIPVLFNEKYCLPRHSTNRLFQEKEVYFELFWQFYDTLKKVYLQIAS